MNALKYIMGRLQLSRQLAALSIREAGIDDQGDCFVRLDNGPIFYGPPTPAKLKKYYRLVPGNVRRKLPFECFNVATDILIRFVEGGLKLNGPRKEHFYKVRAGDRIAEMGAYRGYYTLYLALRVGKEGKILAIEPMPDSLRFLRKNVEANGLSQVQIVEKGVWSEPTQFVFNRRPEDMQSASIQMDYTGSDTYQVTVDSLDNILHDAGLDSLDMILIQLNGAEFEAIKGLTEVQPRNFAIAARYNSAEENVRDAILKTLEERGYSCQVLEEEFVFAEKL